MSCMTVWGFWRMHRGFKDEMCDALGTELQCSVGWQGCPLSRVSLHSCQTYVRQAYVCTRFNLASKQNLAGKILERVGYIRN
jgi:hypothetical protein